MKSRLVALLSLLLPLVASQVAPTPAPPSCEGVEEFAFVASPHDCQQYYQCIESTAFRLQCPRGLYFSTAQQTCVRYDESDCGLAPPPPALPTCDDVPDFGFIPSLAACELYYQCIEGVQFQLQCPRGFYFSFKQQNCVRPDDSDCPLFATTPMPPPTTPPARPPRPTCADVDEYALIPAVDCKLYYICVEPWQYLLQCPRGTYFSFAAQTCGRYDDSDCWTWSDMHED